MGNTLSCTNGGHRSKKSKSDFHFREYYRANTSEMSAKNSEKSKIDNNLRQKISDNEIIDKKATAIDDNFDGQRKVSSFTTALGCN